MKHTPGWLLAFVGFVLFVILFWRVNKIMNRKQFKEKFLREAAGANVRGFNLVVILALASYESGDGMGSIAQATNNIFSLTASPGYKGKTYKAKSGYVFRVYGSWKESIEDFTKLLTGWPSNYGPATAAAIAGDMTAFARALQNPLKGPSYAYGDPGKTTYAAELQNRYQAFA